ncbi:MAG: signal peptidase II [Acidobacteria bacterium]|nr:MAG: signal peptidase II [Acidobacteriota bacterium]
MLNCEKKKGLGILTAVCFGALTLSQLFNYFVFRMIPEGQSWKIKSWLFLTHIRNHGGIFGVFQGKAWVFTSCSTVLLFFLIWYLVKSEHIKRFELICFGFILGGGFANVLDRLFYGSVIDYFDIRGIPYWHYIFNMADVMIHIGLWSMILFGYILPGKKNKHRDHAQQV